MYSLFLPTIGVCFKNILFDQQISAHVIMKLQRSTQSVT